MIDEFDEIKSLIDTQYSESVDIVDSEGDFIMEVAQRVAELMESNMELFFNHLYRMDINENSIHQVLNYPKENESVYVSIAKIIIERQKKRLETKRKFKQKPIEGWDEY